MKMGQAPIVLIGASPIFRAGTAGKPFFPIFPDVGREPVPFLHSLYAATSVPSAIPLTNPNFSL